MPQVGDDPGAQPANADRTYKSGRSHRSRCDLARDGVIASSVPLTAVTVDELRIRAVARRRRRCRVMTGRSLQFMRYTSTDVPKPIPRRAQTLSAGLAVDYLHGRMPLLRKNPRRMELLRPTMPTSHCEGAAPAARRSADATRYDPQRNPGRCDDAASHHGVVPAAAASTTAHIEPGVNAATRHRMRSG